MSEQQLCDDVVNKKGLQEYLVARVYYTDSTIRKSDVEKIDFDPDNPVIPNKKIEDTGEKIIVYSDGIRGASLGLPYMAIDIFTGRMFDVLYYGEIFFENKRVGLSTEVIRGYFIITSDEQKHPTEEEVDNYKRGKNNTLTSANGKVKSLGGLYGKRM